MEHLDVRPPDLLERESHSFQRADPANQHRQVRARNQSLDVLRGVAVLLVTGYHYAYYRAWARGGAVGVDLFFVLSGFLISGLLFSEYKLTGAVDIGRFLIRRGFKIYPPYYCFVLLWLPLTAHQLRWSDLTFMGAYYPPFWFHGWSLSVEEHFYFVLPVILLVSYRLFRSRNFAWVPWVIPVVCGACLFLRYRYSLSHSVLYGITATHLRMDALFAGVGLGWFQHFRPEQLKLRYSSILALLGVVLVLPAFLENIKPVIMLSVGSLSCLLGFVLILIWAINSHWLGKLTLLSRIGVSSYSIYLWHWPLALIFQGLFQKTWLTFWSYVLISVLTGFLMTKAIEAPSLRLRERVFPRLA